MPPASEPAPEPGERPAADEQFLDHGPCGYPGCSYVGLRIAGALCLVHNAHVHTAGLLRERGLPLLLAGADPIEAQVVRATRPRQWWRCADDFYALIAVLCLDSYRDRRWPPRDPKGVDIEPLLAEKQGRAAVAGNDRAVRDPFRAVTRRMRRRTGQPCTWTFTMARADARAEFEAEHGLRAGADYAAPASR